MKDYVKGGALTEVTFHILLSLYEPRHGYAIMQCIEGRTAGRVSLGAGTLDGALNTLERRGWIARHGDGEGRKKAYLITEEGRAAAEKELTRLRALTEAAAEIIGGAG